MAQGAVMFFTRAGPNSPRIASGRIRMLLCQHLYSCGQPVDVKLIYCYKGVTPAALTVLFCLSIADWYHQLILQQCASAIH
jgi:hypothetical protein